MSVDSLPLEWDHTGDVGGSSSHEDDEEEGEEHEDDRTYFSALSGRFTEKRIDSRFTVFIALMVFKCHKSVLFYVTFEWLLRKRRETPESQKHRKARKTGKPRTDTQELGFKCRFSFSSQDVVSNRKVKLLSPYKCPWVTEKASVVKKDYLHFAGLKMKCETWNLMGFLRCDISDFHPTPRVWRSRHAF